MIESLISDLAYILVLAAVVSLLFKWIKQPVVLGYIVAGFLAGPNFTALPSPANPDNIELWSELGIVVLLFSLGLEFSFKKLMSCGSSAIVTAAVCITGMMCTGFCIGKLLGFSSTNCLFLGGMISMSSTTIILKALTDLGLRHRRFAPKVLGVLIVEDLFAVLLMVVLSSIAINKTVAGGELLFAMAKLGFFLVIWVLVGTYVIPTLLNASRRYLNDETLLVLSMALCLGMAVFSVYCGFSMALGAFVMGSVLAATSYAERIEHVVTPVKNLFGAVFFISVGMMVNPSVIVEYIGPIVLLSAAVIIGMIVFGSAGMLITGQPLKIAVESGFTLTQIGEFSFIIATLGSSLKVLDPTIYPIIVAVSVITTFTTPYFIKLGEPAYEFVECRLPQRWRFLIDRYSNNATIVSETKRLWLTVIKRYLWRLALYTIVLVAIVLVARIYLHPAVCRVLPDFWGRLLCCVITLAAMSPFLYALSFPSSKKSERKRLTKANARFDVPLVVMTVVRFSICLMFLVSVIGHHFGYRWGVSVGVVLFAGWLLLVSRRTGRRLNRIETRFLDNLNERDLRRTGRRNNLVSDMHVAYGTVGYDFPYVGDRLCVSNVGRTFKVNIASIQRGGAVIPVPGGDERLFPGDIVGVIGTEENIAAFMTELEKGTDRMEPPAINEEVKLTTLTLGANSPLNGKSLVEADLRNRHHAMVVAIERDGKFIPLKPAETFAAGDVVWLVAQPSVSISLM